MKKPIILFFIAYLIAWAIAPANASEATLTTQAKHILMQELENNNVDKNLNKQIVCLAENIYFEARAENISGKAAVANVTKNRVFNKQWPSTWCEVVKQGPVRESWKTKQNPDLQDSERVYYPRKHKCQFSWYCDGKKDVIWANYEKTGETIEGNARAWRESVRVALAVMDLEKTFTVGDNTNGALYYYNHNLVYPYWADHMELIGVLGNHTFMK